MEDKCQIVLHFTPPQKAHNSFTWPHHWIFSTQQAMVCYPSPESSIVLYLFQGDGGGLCTIASLLMESGKTKPFSALQWILQRQTLVVTHVQRKVELVPLLGGRFDLFQTEDHSRLSVGLLTRLLLQLRPETRNTLTVTRGHSSWQRKMRTKIPFWVHIYIPLKNGTGFFEVLSRLTPPTLSCSRCQQAEFLDLFFLLFSNICFFGHMENDSNASAFRGSPRCFSI